MMLALLSAGCPSSRWVAVRVQAAGGPPVADATVAAVCEPTGSGAKRTGANGLAVLELRSAPRSCMVTAIVSGYRTTEIRVESVCGDRSSCVPIELSVEAE